MESGVCGDRTRMAGACKDGGCVYTKDRRKMTENGKKTSRKVQTDQCYERGSRIHIKDRRKNERHETQKRRQTCRRKGCACPCHTRSQLCRLNENANSRAILSVDRVMVWSIFLCPTFQKHATRFLVAVRVEEEGEGDEDVVSIASGFTVQFQM